MTFECPIEGCGSVHDTMGKLEMHILHKTDKPHAKYGNIGEVRKLIEEEGVREVGSHGPDDDDDDPDDDQGNGGGNPGGSESSEPSGSGGGLQDPTPANNEDNEGASGPDDDGGNGGVGSSDGTSDNSDEPTDSDGGESGGDGGDEPTCPECGGNVYFSVREYDFEDGDYDYGCPTCSTDEEWVVWSE